MIRFVPLLIIACFFGLQTAYAQVRVGTLLIKKNEVYDLGKTESDILVADTLIMEDSARLILNKLKPDNFIRASVIIIGNHCTIDGKGKNGSAGRNGRHGVTPYGPCKDGTSGRNGARGLDGTKGINFSLYAESITIKGTLIIELAGGNGGRGGNGGDGGSGSTGTVHCNGGNGGNGGNAGQGGNGAEGGKLLISCKSTPGLDQWIGKKIIVHYAGGRPGEPGRAGYYGSAGLGPSNKNGKHGLPGVDSVRGVSGLHGSVIFQ